jgi:tRNA G37 N-methylase TrmD
MKVVKDLNLHDMLKNVVGEHATIVLIMAINRVIRPEAMNNVESWYDDSYLKP